jgi:hypothetical protein
MAILRSLVLMFAGVAMIGGVAAQEPAVAPLFLKDVLDRAGQYTTRYGDALDTVLADEEYLQQLVYSKSRVVWHERELRSEIAFIRVEETAKWLALRNVLRVDGQPVLEPRAFQPMVGGGRAAAILEGLRIAENSARYNIGRVHRTLNFPTLVVQFLLPSNQHRFKFEKLGEETFGDESVWLIAYKEQRRDTIIKTRKGDDVSAIGRFWIAPQDGRLVRASLDLKEPIRTQIDFRWQLDSKLGLWVPVEMREQYVGNMSQYNPTSLRIEQYDIRGHAHYSNYLRFDVDVRIK